MFIQFYVSQLLFLPPQLWYLQYLRDEWTLSYVLITNRINLTFIGKAEFVWFVMFEPYLFGLTMAKK
jgi:hypothetical protein